MSLSKYHNNVESSLLRDDDQRDKEVKEIALKIRVALAEIFDQCDTFASYSTDFSLFDYNVELSASYPPMISLAEERLGHVFPRNGGLPRKALSVQITKMPKFARVVAVESHHLVNRALVILGGKPFDLRWHGEIAVYCYHIDPDQRVVVYLNVPNEDHRFRSLLPEHTLLTPAQLSAEPFMCIVIPSSSRKTIYFICNHLTEYNEPEPMRLVRSLYKRHLDRLGFICLHAAGVHFQGKGYLLGGPARSGKTSTLLNSAQISPISLVANDRVYVGKLKEGGFVAVGWPSPVRIGIGTILAHKQLRHLLVDISGVPCLQYGSYTPDLRYLSLSAEEARAESVKVATTHTHLAKLIGMSLIPAIRVNAFVFTDLNLDSRSPHLEWVSTAEAGEKIMRLMRKQAYSELDWIGMTSVGVVHSAVESLVRLSQQVRMVCLKGDIRWASLTTVHDSFAQHDL